MEDKTKSRIKKSFKSRKLVKAILSILVLVFIIKKVIAASSLNSPKEVNAKSPRKVFYSSKTKKEDSGLLNARQQKIQKYLKIKERVSVKDLVKGFPDVTTRTLRRDMAKLEALGIVKQKGKTKDSLYQIL